MTRAVGCKIRVGTDCRQSGSRPPSRRTLCSHTHGRSMAKRTAATYISFMNDTLQPLLKYRAPEAFGTSLLRTPKLPKWQMKAA